jgi:hypothetical protein
MTVVVAHAGHWLMGLGFASAPLTVIGGIAFLAIREHRRDQGSAS